MTSFLPGWCPNNLQVGAVSLNLFVSCFSPSFIAYRNADEMNSGVRKGKSKRSGPPNPESERKKLEHSARVVLIENFGVEVMPCKRCHSLRKICRMLPNTNRCGECTLAKKKCEGSGPSMDTGRSSCPLFLIVF